MKHYHNKYLDLPLNKIHDHDSIHVLETCQLKQDSSSCLFPLSQPTLDQHGGLRSHNLDIQLGLSYYLHTFVVPVWILLLCEISYHPILFVC